MDKLLRQIFRGCENVFFLQVGSHDGMHGDPLHRLIVDHHRWCGIFVEPVPFLFERLRENYGCAERFIFENVAIAQKSGSLPFYFVAPDAQERAHGSLPEWHDQLGSFDRRHILKHLDGELAPYVNCLRVECLTLPELLARHSVKRIDLMHIDAEGSDYQILSQLDLRRYSPRAVLYEHEHLSTRERECAASFLTSRGYTLRTHGLDTLAVRFYA